ncbi:MAG TPA: NAD-dependent epimerase/dehydratase family protein [Bacteroidia bacterium]
MKIVVTGGAGFIGSHITESLVRKGHKVVVFDNFSTGLLENLSDISSDVEVVRGNILDQEALNKVLKGVDVVSHQAAQLEIFKSTDDPEYDLQVNTIGTLNVLKAAQLNGVSKIVNASSACIYGQVNGLTSELFYPRPNWAYGVSKLAAEKYCDIYSDAYKLPVVNLRYSITYGEREWYRRALTIMCKRIIENKAPVVFGDGQQIRDFLYVGDLVSFHNLVMEMDIANGKSYNVGTGKGTAISKLAELVVEASGKAMKVIFEATPQGYFSKLIPDKRRNTAELGVMLLDISKAEKDTGWCPSVSLIEGLKREINWAKNNLHRWERVVYSK